MTWTPPQSEWEDMRNSLRHLGDERTEDRQMLHELHAAVVGTTREPGMAEGQRKQQEQLDRQDRRIGYVQGDLEAVKVKVTDLEMAPARAAVAEQEDRRQQTSQLQRTFWSKAMDVALKGAVAAVIALVTMFTAMWSGALQALVQRTPPPGT